jgi:hypothetical protein
MENAVLLVVEDEAHIRMSATQTVEDAGFAVVEAFNAGEAIRISECWKSKCDDQAPDCARRCSPAPRSNTRLRGRVRIVVGECFGRWGDRKMK